MTKALAKLEALAKRAKPKNNNKIKGLANWIEANVQLPVGLTAEPGPILLASYMREIADAFTDPLVERITIQKAARVGYSTIVSGYLAYRMTDAPAPVLVVVPAELDARNAVVDLENIFETSPALHGRLPTPSTAGRSSRNTLLVRRGGNGAILRLVGANAPRNLRAITAQDLICDETDALQTTAEGNPLLLAENRTLSFADRKIIVGSTPLLADTSHVCRLYGESDQRIFECKCPDCGDYAEIVWEALSWPEGKPEQAAWTCPNCGSIVGHKHKHKMVADGRWRALHPEVTNHRGYRLSALVSPMVNVSWGRLAADFDKIKADPDRLKVFHNTVLARPWSEEGEDVDENALASRAESFSLDEIPEDVLSLTLGADLADDRIEAVICGWSKTDCYVFAHEVIWGAIEDDLTWRQFDDLLRQRWAHPFGGFLKIDAACVDAGDGGHMQTVLEFTRKRSARRIMATKGVPGFARRFIEASKSKMKGGGRLWIVGSDAIKSRIFNQLQRGTTIRFSNTLSDVFYEQLASERKITRIVGGKPVVRFERIRGMKAECLDALVYNHAARSALNLSDAAFEQRYHDLRTPNSEYQQQIKPKDQEERFAPDRWFGAERGGLRDAQER